MTNEALENKREHLEVKLNMLLSFDDIDDTLKEEVPKLIKEIDDINNELHNRWIYCQGM